VKKNIATEFSVRRGVWCPGAWSDGPAEARQG